MFAPVAKPTPPVIAAPMSVKISPNKLEVTMISKRSGLETKYKLAASTKLREVPQHLGKPSFT